MPNDYLNLGSIAVYLAKANVPFRYIASVKDISQVPVGGMVHRIEVEVIEWSGDREKAVIKIDDNGKIMCWYKGTLRGINFDMEKKEGRWTRS